MWFAETTLRVLYLECLTQIECLLNRSGNINKTHVSTWIQSRRHRGRFYHVVSNIVAIDEKMRVDSKSPAPGHSMTSAVTQLTQFVLFAVHIFRCIQTYVYADGCSFFMLVFNTNHAACHIIMSLIMQPRLQHY